MSTRALARTETVGRRRVRGGAVAGRTTFSAIETPFSSPGFCFADPGCSFSRFPTSTIDGATGVRTSSRPAQARLVSSRRGTSFFFFSESSSRETTTLSVSFRRVDASASASRPESSHESRDPRDPKGDWDPKESLYATPSSTDRRGRNANEDGDGVGVKRARGVLSGSRSLSTTAFVSPFSSSQLAAERHPGLFEGARARYLRFSSASSRRARPS